jgi:hypothetical protein
VQVVGYSLIADHFCAIFKYYPCTLITFIRNMVEEESVLETKPSLWLAPSTAVKPR